MKSIPGGWGRDKMAFSNEKETIKYPLLKSSEGNLLVRCPICGFQYVHFKEVKKLHNWLGEYLKRRRPK